MSNRRCGGSRENRAITWGTGDDGVKVLCYGVLLKILVLCKAANETQKNINGTLLLSVDKSYDVRSDDRVASIWIRCQNNLAGNVIDKKILKKLKKEDLINYFRENVLSLINPDRETAVIQTLKDIINSDDFHALRVGYLGRRQILKEKDSAKFLANVFRYTLDVPNRNTDGADFVATIDEEYLKQFDTLDRKTTLSDDASEILAPEQMILPLFTNCRCLVCGESFLKLGDDDNYFSTHQSVEISDATNGSTETIPLCPNCAAKYEHFSPERKQALINEFRQTKKNAMLPLYISQNDASNAQIATAVKAIYDTSRTSSKPPRYEPSEIDEKIKNEIIIDKIIAAITYHYYAVNDVINNLATANKLTEKKLGRIMRGYYEDVGDNLGYDGTDMTLQEPVFEGIVNEVHHRSHQVSRTVCEWLIAYFIQGCVIFDAVSK